MHMSLYEINAHILSFDKIVYLINNEKRVKKKKLKGVMFVGQTLLTLIFNINMNFKSHENIAQKLLYTKI